MATDDSCKSGGDRPACEIEITLEMLQAGERVLAAWDDGSPELEDVADYHQLARRVYREMTLARQYR